MGSFTLTNLIRGTPKPKYNLVKNGIPVLGSLVMSGVLNEEEVSQALWSIAGITHSQKTRIRQIT